MILASQDFTEELFAAIKNAKSICLLSAAFIKLSALKELAKQIPPSLKNITVVARWQKHDLLQGSSDLEVYNFCKENGWAFGISQNFHGKLYFIDELEVLLGSANLTNRGLMFGGLGNFEFGTRFLAKIEDKKKINDFLKQEVIWMNDELYQQIQKEISETKMEIIDSPEISWSSEIKLRIEKQINFLWITDLPFATPIRLMTVGLNDQALVHDIDMMRIDLADINAKALKMKFKKTKIYLWIVSQLEESGEMNFGGLSKKLHNALLDDPKPYRKNVKELLANIFDWIEFLEEDFEVKKYNRTSTISLKKKLG